MVARSRVLRRRQQRAIEEAIRNGTYIPASARDVVGLEKPVLHDLYLSDGVTGASTSKGIWREEIWQWETTMVRSWPLTLFIHTFNASHTIQPVTAFRQAHPAVSRPDPFELIAHSHPRSLQHFCRGVFQSHPVPLASPTPSPTVLSDDVGVVFLVQMPHPPRPDYAVPPVDFGILNTRDAQAERLDTVADRHSRQDI